TGLRLARFELVLLRELGYSPTLQRCAVCQGEEGPSPAFSAAAGGLLCSSCQVKQRDRRLLSHETWKAIQALRGTPDAWRQPWSSTARAELRQVLNQYVTYLMGRQPRLLPYLGS